ncbi:hypothetical protein LEI94_23195 [Salmonella enterica]|nr:hypothetical protein [Salmonella enterica]
MSRSFIKKEGVAQASLARYLLGQKRGNRLKTIDELSKECQFSVGLIQAALKNLEKADAVTVERRGRNGSYLSNIDNKILLTFADVGNVVCAMPLPYTRLYEGLASGLKAQFDGFPFYYAHMRGSDVRVECLVNGVYDLAVVSRLAAQSYLNKGELFMALELGPHTYVSEHKLIYRAGEMEKIKRAGLDPRSADQLIMTDIYFSGQAVERVDVPYHECLYRIAKGDIDAAIWNVNNEVDLHSLGLVAEPLSGDPRFVQASETVVLTRSDDVFIQQLLSTVVNKNELLAHQQRVLKGEQEPNY